MALVSTFLRSVLKKSMQKAVRGKLWFKVTVAQVPDGAARQGTEICTTAVDIGLKGLLPYTPCPPCLQLL